jgi:hypothetical protein
MDIVLGQPGVEVVEEGLVVGLARGHERVMGRLSGWVFPTVPSGVRAGRVVLRREAATIPAHSNLVSE